ncbi:MAG: relaxase [Hyphomicrobiales bacterium]
MILKGSQRAGATQLAIHLLKDENEHVEVHEISGFVSDNPMGALKEAQAISKGTKCRQFLFSLSLSPPEKEKVPISVFKKAISDIENSLGLAGQPRIIVFHEKEGRRHAHCVWSRIDANKMTAINLPYYKYKLRDISRELYLEHNWQMPIGFINNEERNPLNFNQAEWQQAKRIQQDPRTIKEAFQDCWTISDSRKAFAKSLEERGYYLAKGDRRAFVAVDWRGEVYPISRWIGIKTKEVKGKLGDANELPSIDETKKQIAKNFTNKLETLISSATTSHKKSSLSLNNKRQTLAKHHQDERKLAKNVHVKRKISEVTARSSLLPTGLKALWFRVTGKYRQIKKLNEAQAVQCKLRDEVEMQKLIEQQLIERRQIQQEIRQLRFHHTLTTKKLNRDVSNYLKLSPEQQNLELTKLSHQNMQRKRKKSISFNP